MVSQTLLELNAVAIGNGNVVHVHTEHQTTNIVSISNTCCYACPYSNLLLSLLVLPITTNNFAGDAHTSADMSELDVTMSTLVEVHEVHVDLAPGNLGVILGVEVKQRLLQLLQTLDPHLCR